MPSTSPLPFGPSVGTEEERVAPNIRGHLVQATRTMRRFALVVFVACVTLAVCHARLDSSLQNCKIKSGCFACDFDSWRCVADAQATTNKSECTDRCVAPPTYYSCNNATRSCVPTTKGGTLNKASCDAECVASNTFHCDGLLGRCVLGAGTEKTFHNITECDGSCKPSTNYFACNPETKQCARDPKSRMNSSDCSLKCLCWNKTQAPDNNCQNILNVSVCTHFFEYHKNKNCNTQASPDDLRGPVNDLFACQCGEDFDEACTNMLNPCHYYPPFATQQVFGAELEHIKPSTGLTAQGE
jgi:hypothetical protein